MVPVTNAQPAKEAEVPAKYWQDVLVTLRQIIRATDLHSRKLMKACGLTIPQVVVLRAIQELGNVTVRSISRHVSLSQATVTIILNRLEQRRLVRRVRSDRDKRVVHVVLTPDGEQTLANSPPLLHESFVSRFEALDPWEQTLILSSLQRVAQMMEAEGLDAAPLLDVGAADKVV